MLDAFRVLGLRRLALATPYPAAVGERLVRFIEEAGFEAVSLENLGLLARRGHPGDYRRRGHRGPAARGGPAGG